MIEKSAGDYYWPFEDRKPTRSEFDAFIDTYLRVSAAGSNPLKHYDGPPLEELCDIANVKRSVCGSVMGISERTGRRRLKNPKAIKSDEFKRLSWLFIDKAPTDEARNVLASWLFNTDAAESAQEVMERLENRMRDDITTIARKLSGESLRALYRGAIGIEAISEIESRETVTFPGSGETHIKADKAGRLIPTLNRIAILDASRRIATKNL